MKISHFLRLALLSAAVSAAALLVAQESVPAAVDPGKPAAAPAYPDLSGRVKELETALAAAQTALQAEHAKAASVPAPAPAVVAAPADADLAKELADTKTKLEMSLRAYSLLVKERDELADRSTKSGESLTADRNTLTTRLADAESRATAAKEEAARLDAALTVLQSSSAQTSRDYAAEHLLFHQVRGANTVLAQENYLLKAALARDPNAPRATAITPVPVPAAPTARTYTVAAGDSLSKISQRIYGTPQRWREIYNANRDRLHSESSLKAGLELRIP